MGLLDELTPKGTHQERLQAWIDTRPDDEREEWMLALKDQAKYSTGAICRALKARGFEISENAVYLYRKKMK